MRDIKNFQSKIKNLTFADGGRGAKKNADVINERPLSPTLLTSNNIFETLNILTLSNKKTMEGGRCFLNSE